MTDLFVLTISLYDREIGTLNQLPGDRTLFIFNQDYIDDPNPPTLSLSYKNITGELIYKTKPTQTSLPPFFSNLLPEGYMRDFLAGNMDINKKREFYLLWKLGRDLPGAIKAMPQYGTHIPEILLDKENTMSNLSSSTQHKFQFSLAGIQMKFSAIKHANGGLTIPAYGVGGEWIIKLPDVRFAKVPENEFAMMELARGLGINVPETALVPLNKISGLPLGIYGPGSHAFVIKRFDRTAHGGRIHMEDFAQVFGLYPYKKYGHASYRNIAEVIWLEAGIEGISEFIRRLIFNVLIGNGDMHLKNWSLIYLDGHIPSLAPAYDFVSTIGYIQSEKMALNFLDSKAFESINTKQLIRFANKVGMPTHLILDVTTKTVQSFLDHWQNIGKIHLDNSIKQSIETHLKALPLIKEFG